MNKSEPKSRPGCQRCGTWGGDEQMLCGIYMARLCMECTNQWDVFIHQSQEWKELLSNDTRHQNLFVLTGRDGDTREADHAALLEREFDLRRQLFALAESWVRDGSRKDTESEAA